MDSSDRNNGMKEIKRNLVNFDFWTQWIFQYNNELPIGEAIAIYYLT